MAHVSWPTRAQTIAFTLMVIVISVFAAFYLSFFDAVFTQGLRYALDNAPRFKQEAQTNPAIDVKVATSTTSGEIPNFTVTPVPTN
jgi:preprotein translocase SecE subunit